MNDSRDQRRGRSGKSTRTSVIALAVVFVMLAAGCQATKQARVHRVETGDDGASLAAAQVNKATRVGKATAPSTKNVGAAGEVPPTTTTEVVVTTTAAPPAPTTAPPAPTAPPTTAPPAPTVPPTAPPTTAPPPPPTARPPVATPAPVGTPYGYASSGGPSGSPSAAYTGPLSITSPGVIENVVIDGCLKIQSSGVTIRNVVINCSGWNAIDNLDDGNTTPVPINGLRVENSRVNCSRGDHLGKMFRLTEATNVVIRGNDLIGCDQTFYLNGNVDGFVAEYNHQHDPIISSSSHWEVISVGEEGDRSTNGYVTLRGNQFSTGGHGGGAGITDLVFMPMDGGGYVTMLLESNYIPIANYHTVRCDAQATCHLNYNVFDTAIRQYNQIGDQVENSAARCNVYADGQLIGVDDGSSTGFNDVMQVDNADCPPY